MEQKITIEIPEGKNYEKTIDDNGNIVIKFVDKPKVKSKSWDEFCKNHTPGIEYYIGSNGVIIKTEFTEKMYPNNFVTREDAEGNLALIQLTRLHDEWVDGWVPNWDWDSRTQTKYTVYYYCGNLTVDYTAFSKRLLVFPTEEMAIEFLDCFRDLIEKAKKFI